MPVSRKYFVKNFFLWIAAFRKRESFFRVFGEIINGDSLFKRVRPGDAGWPGESQWLNLNSEVNGKLMKLVNPFTYPDTDLFIKLKNPYYIRDTPELTQSLGWAEAWKSYPSEYAVAAETAKDIQAAVNFARRHNLRLVVKGGAHSYQGNSNAGDSLLIWTRKMDAIEVHDLFLPEGFDAQGPGIPAVTVGAGAIWGQVYDAVSTKHGRYVQGGGCLTVGVAGLLMGGGFGSFSKYYGVAAAGILEAELVTADGVVRTVNSQREPDLFWAIRGGGGGSFGVVTKLTLATKELPETFGAVFGRIVASTDKTFKSLIEKVLILYKEHLFNPAWGEQMIFNPDRSFRVSMLFHGLAKESASAAWQEFQDWIHTNSADYKITQPITFVTLPARHLWDPVFLKKNAPDLVGTDDRPGASENNIYWKSNLEEAGQFLYAYQSAWLPEELLETPQLQALTQALFQASRHWTVSLHFNKGLAGSSEEVLKAAAATAVHPALTKAFALVIIAAEGAPAYPGFTKHEPDMEEAKTSAAAVEMSMQALKSRVKTTGSYISESNFFEENWQDSYWGSNYARLLSIKKTYDPAGLFFVHHGVGSESWSPDGFTRLA
jgi:FAD/FMN-containing dehydrogenase